MIGRNPSRETGKYFQVTEHQSKGAPERKPNFLWRSFALVLCAQILALEVADISVFVEAVKGDDRSNDILSFSGRLACQF